MERASTTALPRAIRILTLPRLGGPTLQGSSHYLLQPACTTDAQAARSTVADNQNSKQSQQRHTKAFGLPSICFMSALRLDSAPRLSTQPPGLEMRWQSAALHEPGGGFCPLDRPARRLACEIDTASPLWFTALRAARHVGASGVERKICCRWRVEMLSWSCAVLCCLRYGNMMLEGYLQTGGAELPAPRWLPPSTHPSGRSLQRKKDKKITRPTTPSQCRRCAQPSP